MPRSSCLIAASQTRTQKIDFTYYTEIRNGKPETRTIWAFIVIIKSPHWRSRNRIQYISPLVQYYTVCFIYFLALYHECKTRLGQVLHEDDARTCTRACSRANTPIHDARAKSTSTSTCNDAPFHLGVSIRPLRLSIILYDYARLVVKVLMTERWDVGSLALVSRSHKTVARTDIVVNR